MKFKIGERELDFDLDSKEIAYKDKVFTPSVRTFGDMKELYSEVGFDFKKDDNGLYFMYRDVFFENSDKELLSKNNIRYDITIILPMLFGNEFNKTYGHYHPKNPEGKYYQELYQVLSGEAIFFQQNKEYSFFTKANTKDAVNMDESYGHITINPSESEILVMANLVDDTFSSVYDNYRDLKGGNFYYFKSGFSRNKNYKNNIELNEKIDKFEVSSDSIYDDFLINQEKFNYLH